MKTEMITKKIHWILLFCLVSTLPALAQQYNRRPQQNPPRVEQQRRSYTSRWNTYDRETYFGFRLGLTVATVNSDDAELDGGGGMAGFNVGIIGGTQLGSSTPIFLESGLFYTEKGGKGYHSGSKFTYDLNYLEVPIVVKYKFFLDDNDISIQPFLGGFLACGVAGKIKNYGDRIAHKSFSDDNFRRFDGGIRLGCGVAFQNFYLDMIYDFGLANICHDTFDTSHTGCFYITVGVDF